MEIAYNRFERTIDLPCDLAARPDNGGMPRRDAALTCDGLRRTQTMSEPEHLLTLPLLPLKNSVLFPSVLMPLTVGRRCRSPPLRPCWPARTRS